MRRFLRPSLRRPLPVFLTPTHHSVGTAINVLGTKDSTARASPQLANSAARKPANLARGSGELRIVAAWTARPQAMLRYGVFDTAGGFAAQFLLN